jgi:excisionase family DNA binding protein
MAATRHAIDGQQVQPAAASLGRLALSKHEAADALGVSIDFLEEHVMHELRIVRRGRRRLIPVRELERWLEENALRTLDSERRLGR